jgi:tetratricopeptide (TPR) repeat protein
MQTTPSVLILDRAGREIDWLVGYAPPADAYVEKLRRAVQGIDTYRSLTDLYAKDPKNIETAWKLARKYDQRLSTSAKADELYREVMALDPDGKAGLVDVDYPKVRVSYGEYAEFILGRKNALGAKADLAPIRAFIQHHPESPLVKTGYMFMSVYYGNYATPAEARAFFEEYINKYPDDVQALDSYVRRIIKDKEPLDKGIELADKIAELTVYNPDPYDAQNRAELYWLLGNKDKVEEIFGKEFLSRQMSEAAYVMSSYAEFWSERGTHLEEALEAVDLAIRIQPETVQLRQIAATIYAKAGRPEKALEVYGPEFVRKNRDKTDALYPYAWYWNQHGTNLESALEAIGRVIEIQPGLAYFDLQAQILLKLKRYDQALKSAERALALAQESAKRRPGFSTKLYESRVQEIRAALAAEKK